VPWYIGDMLKIAFVGFRHPHIFDLLGRCQDRQDVEVVACCEQDDSTRQTLAESGDVQITHESYEQMLSEVACDVIAVGDYYGCRGHRAIAALEAGCHVISDKPICTDLKELDQIEKLAQQKQCVVGCMLDMRDLGVFAGLRDVVQSGRIGEVQAISFGGQHPLNYGTRPPWYFEPGKHGGALNDIAIHALDLIPWVTGLQFSAIHSARCWGAALPDLPHFKECGQAMLSLENGAGVLCDVSYLLPDSFGYTHPLYWRFTLWGTGGVVEVGYNVPTIQLWARGETESESIDLSSPTPGAYLDAFVAEVGGASEGLHLSSADSLAAARLGLQIQAAADDGQANVLI
jgi:predicted dehydrogenase